MNDGDRSLIERREESVAWWHAVWAVTAAFGAYFCMYGFRKPFTAAEYAGGEGGALAYKTMLVTSQVLGYTISKFIGIRVISEMPARWRAAAGFGLVLIAEVTLVLFAITPWPWNVAFLFLNGLPLGMVFGTVLAPLEGRRLTEALTAGLCASFILAGGVMKSTGAWLLGQGVSEAWMPAAAGTSSNDMGRCLCRSWWCLCSSPSFAAFATTLLRRSGGRWGSRLSRRCLPRPSFG
ncbi:hypothetical protein EBU58_06730 [bacterium]|nr:hypothetical protein [bacterium]